MIKQTLTLAFLAGANTLVTVIFQWYLFTQLGVGFQTDALIAGMAVPQFVLLVLSGTLPAVLLPLLAAEQEEAFRENAWGFFLGIGGLFAALALAFTLTAPYWVPLLVPGFSPQARSLTITLSRIQLVNMLFTACLSVLWAVHRSRHKFVWVELGTLLGSVTALFLLFPVLPVFGIVGAAWLLALGSALPVLFLLPGLGRWKWPDWGSPVMREAWRRLRPLLLGTAYYRTDPLIDRLLASMAPAGGLSLLYIGQQIFGVANTIAEKAIATPMIPRLAIAARAREWPAFRHTYRRRLLAMAALTVLGYAILILAGEPILALLIGHGGVTRANVDLLWRIMVALGGFLIGGAMGLITSNGFYAMGDTRTPTRIGIWTYTVYVPAKILIFHYYGLIGLALSISAFGMANLVLQFFALEKPRHAVPVR